VLDLAGADAEGQRAERAVVAVWLSPQTIVIPGCVRPNSGPMTCTIPCSGAPKSNRRTPNSRQLLRIISICAAESGSAIGLCDR